MVVFGFSLAIFIVSLNPGDSRVISEPASSIWDITQESSTSDICSDCSQVIELFTDMVSNKDTQETICNALNALCMRLPPGRGSYCISQVKKYLPKVLQYVIGHLKPGEACAVLGLCAIQSERELLELVQSERELLELVQSERELLEPVHSVTDTDMSSAVLNTGTSPQVQVGPQCTLCLFIIRKLENMLPKNRTEDAVLKVMGEVCDLLPASYKDQCDDFINKYGKDIVDFLLSSAAPHSICAMLHLCLFNEKPSVDVFLPSDCDSCRTLAVLSRLHLGLNSTESRTSSFLQSVCLNHPNAIPKCEVFTQLYGSRLQKVLGNQMNAPDACERADLCVAVKKSEPMLGNNRCTWGPSYWCQDRTTAQKCGNVAFCEKFMWN